MHHRLQLSRYAGETTARMVALFLRALENNAKNPYKSAPSALNGGGETVTLYDHFRSVNRQCSFTLSA
jgi:hypothetical protein